MFPPALTQGSDGFRRSQDSKVSDSFVRLGRQIGCDSSRSDPVYCWKTNLPLLIWFQSY